jgi:hypothetical protein
VVSDGEGLDYAEVIVIESLEDSPASLPEIGWAEAPSRQRVADVCGPALVSLAARGFIEVRRFAAWPSPWTEGTPMTAEELDLGVEAWSDAGEGPVVAVHITEAGVPWL